MNRDSFFDRLVAPGHLIRPSSSLDRRDRKLVGLEVLEDRKMLVFSVYVNDNWVNLDNPGQPVQIGDYVQSQVDDNIAVIAEYGFDAFGTVEGTSQPGAATIHDAIANTSNTGTLTILSGTYQESDIVVDKPIHVEGSTGVNPTLIVPEAVSSHANAEDFGVGTHSGIIIYSPSVTIENLTVDGNGNGSLAGTLNYHQGITTLYTQQNGSDYSTLHNGTLAPSNMGGDDATTYITIHNVTVTNTWWHGITLSGLSGTNIRTNRISNVTVSNVGEVGSRDLNRIGILLQNHDGGDVRDSSVSDVGVGIETGVLGPASFGDNSLSRNRTGILRNTVTDAVQRAYSVTNADGQIDLSFILSSDAQFTGFDANKAIYTSPANSGTGLYLNHSQPVVIGYESINAKIGALIENTTVDNLLLPIFAGTTITGPGVGVSGSVGILADNAGDPTHAVNFGIGGTTTISGFETGIRINQTTPVAEQNLVQIDRPTLTGNGIAISVGNNSVFQGNAKTGDSVVTTGTGSLQPGFPNSFFIVDGPGAPPSYVGPFSDVMDTGDVNLNSSGTFDARLTGQSGSTTLFSFDEEVGDFPFGVIPPVPDNGTTTEPNGSSFPSGQVNQSGGQLKIANGALNGPLNVAYNTLNHEDPNNPGTYILDPVDISDYSHLDIKVKLGAGNQAKAFIFGLADTEGQIALFTFSTEGMSSTTYSTLTLNLAAPGIPFSLGPSGNFDLTKVMGYAVLGDEGLINGASNVPFSLTFDEVVAKGVVNSELNVTGTVSLGGANLNVSAGPALTPTVGQQWTIINNDGADAVSGTFSSVTSGYSVSYTAGDGNDVVLTYTGTSVTPMTVVGQQIFYNNSSYDANTPAISASDDAAIATDKAAFNGVGTAPTTAFTSYSKGINGIMIDVTNEPGNLSLSDFTFKVGTNNMPNLWANAPAPTGFSIRPGAGAGGSDRVEIIWADSAVANEWLQVVVRGNDTVGGNWTNTGLTTSDVFFYGNRIGDNFTGEPPTLVTTNAGDEIYARNNTGFLLPVTNITDFNKDKFVNAADQIVARNNGGFLTRVINWVPPAAPVASPSVATSSSDGTGSAVASALAIHATPSLPNVPGWIASRLASVDLNSGPIATVFTHLAAADTPRTRQLLQAVDQLADDLGLDDSLLDSLIGDLS